MQRQDSVDSATGSVAASVSSDGAPEPNGSGKGSVYALACTANATLLAAGTTQHCVRVLDPRTRSKVRRRAACPGRSLHRAAAAAGLGLRCRLLGSSWAGPHAAAACAI
jgi:hypothetical protein